MWRLSAAAHIACRPRALFGLLPPAEEDVGPPRALDRPARVLRQHQPLEFAAIHGVRRVEPDRRPQRHHGAIHRDRAAGCEWHAECAHGTHVRPLVRGHALAQSEEHVGGVFVEHLCHLLRMRGEPGANRLHRHAILRQRAAFHQLAADGDIGQPILRRIGHAHHAAIGQIDAPGTLHLQEERIHRIGHVQQRQMLPIQRAVLDVGPAVIGHQGVALHAAGDRAAMQVGDELAQIGLDQIIRPAEQRRGERPLAHQAARHLRLVIAGELRGRVAGIAQPVGGEILREKGPGGCLVMGRHGGGPGAHAAPVSGMEAGQRLAGQAERRRRRHGRQMRAIGQQARQRVRLTILGPARQAGEGHFRQARPRRGSVATGEGRHRASDGGMPPMQSRFQPRALRRCVRR